MFTLFIKARKSFPNMVTATEKSRKFQHCFCNFLPALKYFNETEHLSSPVKTCVSVSFHVTHITGFTVP